MKEKIRNAYLLFYERTALYDNEGNKINQMIDISSLEK